MKKLSEWRFSFFNWCVCYILLSHWLPSVGELIFGLYCFIFLHGGKYLDCMFSFMSPWHFPFLLCSSSPCFLSLSVYSFYVPTWDSPWSISYKFAVLCCLFSLCTLLIIVIHSGLEFYGQKLKFTLVVIILSCLCVHMFLCLYIVCDCVYTPLYWALTFVIL